MTSKEIWHPMKCDILVLLFQEIWLPGKYDFPGNIFSQEIQLPRNATSQKFNFPGNVNFWEMWLPGIWGYVTPGKCYFLRNMTSLKNYMHAFGYSDINTCDTCDKCDHRWKVWPRVTSVTICDMFDHMWQGAAQILATLATSLQVHQMNSIFFHPIMLPTAPDTSKCPPDLALSAITLDFNF